MDSVSILLNKQFTKPPTEQQKGAFLLLEHFLASRSGDECFLLRGYAGTGKTTILSNLVPVLEKLRLKAVLLAPTGRAAKVIGSYSGRKAHTIHKRIYRKKNAVSPDMAFVLADNLAENTIYIVDEASMISSQPGEFGRRSLLHDLVDYVYNNRNCKLMLVGDSAQLPPVGSDDSPALDIKFLQDNFTLNVFTCELTDVVRQEKESGILFNATRVRELIRKKNDLFPEFAIGPYKDIYRMSGEKLPEGLHYAYDKYGIDNTLVVCRSNKSANAFNQNIRNRILYREEEITGGDYVMVVRNNYYWLKDEDKSGSFIANGDIAKIRKVRNIHEQHGFRFADAVLEMVDYPGEEPLTCKVMLDTLYAASPSLSREDHSRLFESVMLDYAYIQDRRLRMLELKNDPFYNALQIKFAFAVTCHKAQGGQWDAVFVDQGYLTDEMLNTEFLRWLYTAVTRASKELFLVNFSDRFFK